MIAGRQAWAQPAGKTFRLAVLVQAPRDAAHWIAFFDELRKLGFPEGVNLSVVDAFNTPLDRADAVATMIVNARPDAIITAGALTRVLQRATETIPIVTVSDDLLAEKVVTSLSHPDGNATGISILATELDGKRQEILLEAIPDTHRLAILADLGVTKPEQLEALENTAKARGLMVSTHIANRADDIMPAIDAALNGGAQALNVLASSLFNRYQTQIFGRMAAARLPAIYQWPEMAEQGGLIAYGPRFVTLYRQQALQVVKVLKGAKTADIPV
jgi:putative ABC transport system substrate-binding protein